MLSLRKFIKRTTSGLLGDSPTTAAGHPEAPVPNTRGERDRPYQELNADRPDSIAILGGEESTYAVRGIEQGDRHTRGSSGHMRQEDEPAVESEIPEQGPSYTTLGALDIPTDVEEAAGEYASLKSLQRLISAVYANHQESVAARNRVEGILSRVASLDKQSATQSDDESEQEGRDDVIRELKHTEKQLRSLSKEPTPQWLIEYGGDIFGPLERLREAIIRYQVRQMEICQEKESHKLIISGESAVLDKLPYAQRAEYRHGDRDHCLEGTHSTILDDIESWTREPQGRPVYWLNGLAGTGKTTIAQTVAERFFADGKLGASFFCSRDSESRRNLHIIFPTIAVQLARRHAEFRSILVPLVCSDPLIAHQSLYAQMEKLIVQPLLKSAISTVIVIDALSECEDDEPASAILDVLARLMVQIPKVNLPPLRDATRVYTLQVNENQVKRDIRLFYKHNLAEISRRYGLGDWPTEKQLGLLCDRAEGLFVYAAITIKFIGPENEDPKARLDRLIQSGGSVSEEKDKPKPSTILDSLYMSILDGAFGGDDPANDSVIRSVLGALALATNPLSPSTIAALLDFDIEDVSALLSSVHSLLILPEDINQPVRPFHKSFHEFIVDAARCTNPRFCVSPPDQHTELLAGCLRLMKTRLRQNMCGLQGGVINAEVTNLKERAEQYIGGALEYACRSWHKHLGSTQKSKIAPVLHDSLEKDILFLLEEKFLFWLEALSVFSATREAVDALKTAEKWLDSSRTLDLAGDYLRFVLTFFGVISASAPHIYISALPLSPKKSLVRQLYYERCVDRPLVRVVRGLPSSWDPILATAYHEDFRGVATWSPSGRLIAIAKSTTIEILDAATLERLITFNSPQNTIHRQLCFSPEDRVLTQFYRGKLTSWDLRTGSPFGTASSEEWNARLEDSFSFTYSKDGRILAVSGISSRYPSLIDTYDLLFGTHTRSCRAPERRLVTPIWTEGEYLRFVTVKQGAITIWEAAFTSVHTPKSIESLPAPDEIADAKDENWLFLPARSLLAFTARGMVLVWDAQAPRFLLKPRSTPTSRIPNVCKMSFSSDGRVFAHTTADQEVHVWKEAPAGYVLHQKLAFPPGQTDPLLSPDGESIIAAGRPTIHLWHTKDKILFSPSVSVRGDGGRFIISFSPNAALAASASFGGHIVKILDLQSGALRLTIDADMEVRCLGLTESTVAIAGRGEIATWKIPEENRVDARVGTKHKVHTISLDPSGVAFPDPRSISRDFSRIATVVYSKACSDTGHLETGVSQSLIPRLQIHDMSNGKRLACINVPHLPEWVALDEGKVWCKDRKDPVEGWTIIEGSKPGVEKIPEKIPSPQAFPWESHFGYEVIDEWVFSPTKKRLLWLPHNWRSREESKTWNGRFLGLGHGGLPEVVILEFLD
ncbi:hypothetical protein BJ322DRAFT_1178577 [Thelephora terrestris]|uniref:Nephrocystin 3-like N-terminal domain-containing protein n=1 Tax=Thelephora terrestris TaxID=56493 RepID=A0A9P6HLA1_9AGAM|nr:hypothetical protein BJ322DRAFT_1178577 [Thelephora terrestris]